MTTTSRQNSGFTSDYDPAAAAQRHLRVVRESEQDGQGRAGTAPVVGYVVLVPPGTDPADVFPAVPAGHRAAAPQTHRPGPTGPPGGSPPAPPGRDGGIRIDTEGRIAEVDGRQLDLTFLEFELLAHLVTHPRRVHSREALVTTVWGYDHIGDGRTVDVHIARLRRKLGRAHRHRIVTVRRMGYKYEPDRR